MVGRGGPPASGPCWGRACATGALLGQRRALYASGLAEDKAVDSGVQPTQRSCCRPVVLRTGACGSGGELGEGRGMGLGIWGTAMTPRAAGKCPGKGSVCWALGL